MEEKARTLNVRPLLVALAVVAAAAAIWAATALAGDGSSANEPAASTYPTTVFVQTEDDDNAPARGNCPEDGSGSGGEDGSGESSSDDL
jgi:hypothetical protein